MAEQNECLGCYGLFAEWDLCPKCVCCESCCQCPLPEAEYPVYSEVKSKEV
jgi:hypothetical protein